ncbi:glutathione-dependent formaldehyde-activating, GFA [Psychromonas ingrahamii 37]|uniref:Glutathione-dependent formaldehyde-activating, GFA n=1 Tax=Psychromonas ingrahamii (strain DSM 17664 / CCUG 51855 / 37) TaxID=357804 RepID=A1SSH9_PSYIN|nr:GFA family protein [Psychromonas ingrahamii]ABM02444.1 glutathione-dependent formaldehyde-activating, GFA [Psychromonas ingrahamii 37]
MPTLIKNEASCLCGSVKINVANVNPKFTVCHCDACRNWGGGPSFSVQCGTEVNIKGAENIKEYNSSFWASRGFCSTCGTHLFYRLNQSGGYNIPVGLFSKVNDFVMTMQYFSDQRPDYYCFSNQTEEMTRAEIKSYFSSKV